jgi:hypothetical protein
MDPQSRAKNNETFDISLYFCDYSPPPIQCSQEKNLTLQDLQYTFVSFVQHCLWEDRAIGRQ